MKLRFKARALRDLEEIHRYISQFDSVAAKAVVRRIEHSIGRLSILPTSGRPSVKGTRLLVVPGLPYVVVHRVSEDAIDVIAVLHTARRRRT
jgi:addiction module RelE/StbE family toxin